MRNEKWILINKAADFQGIGERFGLDPVIARVMNNRGVVGDENIRMYLQGGTEMLHNPHLMKDMDLCAAILKEKIQQGKHIRIIGDYDIDGVQATYILYKALQKLNADVSTVLPDRIVDGYGLNVNLVEKALADGVDTILTCDNGISAIDAIRVGKEAGLTILVTDHHQVPTREENGVKMEVKSQADAIVNPHQKDCPYPFKELCGAGVAFKLVQVLYEVMGLPVSQADVFLENAGFATVGDVMPLKDENRILTKEALKRLETTDNKGMKALINQLGLDDGPIMCHHIGFRLGPCINASGRLDTAKHALKLLCAETDQEANRLAADLIAYNENRKELTRTAENEAYQLVDNSSLKDDSVLCVYLPDCHESLAGIVAGRLRERYGKPSFVMTRTEECIKGSGRSIEEYSMYEEMSKCSDLFLKFGGHPMAAGFSLKEENIEALRKTLNENSRLTEDDLAFKVKIDVPMPMSYVHRGLIDQLNLLEPYGTGNTKPVFAEKDVTVVSARVGRNGNVVNFRLEKNGRRVAAVMFRNIDEFFQKVQEKYGVDAGEKLRKGYYCPGITMHFVYYPKVNYYNGSENLQMEIQAFL